MRIKKNQTILEAATLLFLKNGFSATSMDEIAEVANVSKRTIYQHFQDKQCLFQVMLAKHWEQILSGDMEIFNEKKSIAENLKNFSKEFFKFLYQPETINLFRLLISESHRHSHLTDLVLINETPPFKKELIKFLKSCQEQGLLKMSDVDRAASFFLGLLKEYHFWPMMLGFTKTPHPPNQNQFQDEAIQIFLKAYIISASVTT